MFWQVPWKLRWNAASTPVSVSWRAQALRQLRGLLAKLPSPLAQVFARCELWFTLDPGVP